LLISVTAPRKGMGQTITSINIAAAITKIINEKVILIDTNKHCGDVENYLSDTKITKGLDDFISMYNSNLLNSDSFNACVKTAHKIDIMSANECLDLNSKAIKVLLEYSKIRYKTIIIDAISGKNPIGHMFFEQSDVVVVVLNQAKHLIDMICQTDLYKPYKGKLVFIVNRFIDKFEEKKINFSLANIMTQLTEAGLGDRVFSLAYDMDVINECNDNAVLNYVLNNNSVAGKYAMQLLKIVDSLIIDNVVTRKTHENKRKNNFLNIFGAKEASTFASRV
jgi:MinD-like ATPase involved in chromosome partitioning or flagellar assembly